MASNLFRVRRIIAQVIWTLAVVAALFLALGALLVALKANQDNALVKLVLNVADAVDLGVFDRDNGIKQFTGNDAAVKNALFNWGIGALAWLLAGRLVERVLRPGSTARD
ncbi:hypothetical protein [Nocardioides nematodiphilus]|uniref:hypothetical protein n=1 Tax=Nocardioides nematodiphilus TaxID=2849669 RepID=UPI001CD9FB2A|nr:hypothetical protein [Nocardioides nematodiphilus]MCA1982301.1 hypothetical protein [Nocardioides nematodiphilus]